MFELSLVSKSYPRCRLYSHFTKYIQSSFGRFVKIKWFTCISRAWLWIYNEFGWRLLGVMFALFGPVVTDLCAISKPNVSFHGMFKYYLAQDIQLEFVNSSGIMLMQKCVYLAFCWWNVCLSGLKYIDAKWSTFRRHLNSWMKTYWFQIKCHCSVFLWSNWQHNGLCLASDKPLSDSMMIRFTDACLRHSASMS